MSLYSCFSEIIGFTQKEDLCVEGYEPEYSTSLSGLYVDELQGMTLRILDSLGGNSDLWEKMTRARENAINDFTTDVVREVMKYNQPVRQRFFGDIASKAHTRVVPEADYYGLRMYSDVKGGQYTLNGVSLILDSTEDVNLLIYDDYDLLHTIQISSVAGRPRRNNITPVTLDLNGNYYFLVAPLGRPLQNKLTCGCGGFKWCFNPAQPCYKHSRDKWTEWCMIAGVAGSDINDRDNWSLAGSSKGMILHGVFNCNALGVLCSEHSDFQNNEIDRAIALAILFKTGEFLTNYILDSEEVSRYTLLGTESLSENRLYYNSRYVVMVDYIAQNAEITKNECLKCKSPYNMGRRTQRL